MVNSDKNGTSFHQKSLTELLQYENNIKDNYCKIWSQKLNPSRNFLILGTVYIYYYVDNIIVYRPGTCVYGAWLPDEGHSSARCWDNLANSES